MPTPRALWHSRGYAQPFLAHRCRPPHRRKAGRGSGPPATTPMPKTLICDCNRTMPLDPKALGAALHEELTLHSTLCRREAGAFQQAVCSGDTVLVACTQEERLFTELAG